MWNNIRAAHLLLAVVAITTISVAAESQSQNVSSTPSLTTTSTTTTTTTASPSSTTASTQTSTPTPTTTTPTMPTTDNSKVVKDNKDIEEAKKSIQQASSQNAGRLSMNRPTTLPQMADFAPDSIEARAADATTQFGLNLLGKMGANVEAGQKGENVVISPLSLQSLLSMILLGATDNSTTQQELVKVLGYEANQLFGSADNDRLSRAHEALHNVLDSIMRATHLSVDQSQSSLLNTNPTALKSDGNGEANENANGEDGVNSKVAVAHLQTSLKANDTPLSQQVNFTVANLMLTNRELIELSKDYEKDLKEFYNIQIEEFSHGDIVGGNSLSQQQNRASNNKSEPLHERVNNWVKRMTENQIDRLAEEQDLRAEDLMMVLLNAAHFKGRWLHTFNPKATQEGTFFSGGKESGASRTMFMRQKAVFGYADFGSSALQAELAGLSETKTSDDTETLLTEDAAGAKSTRPVAASSTSSTSSSSTGSPPTIELSREESRRLELTSNLNCSVLMLPFSLNDGQELSMVVLLPSKLDGLAELQAALNGPALNEIYRSLSEQQVQVELPKFSFESSLDAKATLQRLGLSKMFDMSAQLGRMQQSAAKTPAKVDKLIHKAKISVDESGAEAAAASMASIVLRNFMRPPTPLFVADHPFLFVIRHNRSNMPLFMGRVSQLSG